LIRTNFSSGYPFEDAYGYSRAVRVGNQIFVSGTTARAHHLEGDAYKQMIAAIAAMRAENKIAFGPPTQFNKGTIKIQASEPPARSAL